MRKAVDLHVHSTKSDGTMTPSELVKHAQEIGLTAFALTDHDSTDGLAEAVRAAQGTPVEVVPGIEFSTEYNGRDIHVLGYFFDYSSERFQERIHTFADARDLRNQKMCSRLQNGGMDVPYEALREENPNAVITRAHFARYMTEHGITKSNAEAFQRYIGDDCPYFVPRRKISPQMAVEFILEFHGMPVLAHPLQYHLGKEMLEALVRDMKAKGLMGLECIYSKYSPADVRELETLAARCGLLPTGGSDYHGANKPGLEMGTGYDRKLYVPESVLTAMKHRLFHTDEHTKILFADLDGTLLDSKKKITPGTMTCLKDWAAAGNLLVLHSGRALFDVKHMRTELGLGNLPGMFCGGFNGAEVYDCTRDVVMFREGIPFDSVRKIMDIAEECGVYCQTYDDSGIVTRRETEETDYYRRWIRLEVRTADDVTQLLRTEPGKCIAIEIHDTAKLEVLRRRICTEMQGRVAAFYSNPNYLEIVSVYASKGLAVQRLSRTLGILPQNTYAAGDSENDISMLRAAGTGIAMCNGLPDLPALAAAADVITESDNDHDGLVPVLRKAMGQ
jgi:Cof subfamily protein (haloacid dehalogenase superfamily)